MDAKVSSVHFWLRLLRTEDERLPRKSYNEVVNMFNNGRQYWVSAVHMNFMMWGEYVWADQRMQNGNRFLCVFTERIDSWWQGLDDRIHERDRSTVYLN